MQEILDDHLDNPQLTDKEIFTKIWYSPREVFRFINDNIYDKHINILLFLAGFASAINQAMEENIGLYTSMWVILLSCALLGPFFTWIGYYLFAMATHWTGKWVEGKGDTASIYKMFIYASTPSAVIAFLLMPLLAIYGKMLFTSMNLFVNEDGSANWIMVGFALLEFILAIWAIVLFIIGISEVQKITIGKAILNLFLPVLIFLGPIIVLIVVVNIYFP